MPFNLPAEAVALSSFSSEALKESEKVVSEFARQYADDQRSTGPFADTGSGEPVLSSQKPSLLLPLEEHPAVRHLLVLELSPNSDFRSDEAPMIAPPHAA